MDNKKRKYVILGGVAALMAAFGFLIVNGVSARAMSVNDVGSDPAAFTGTIRITGIVAGTSREDPSIIGMMDRKELQCTTPNCNKLYIPFKAAGYLPNRGDEVVVEGRFVAMGEGYLFMADSVKVVKTHQLGG